MNRTPQNQRSTHARRHPDSVKRNAASTPPRREQSRESAYRNERRDPTQSTRPQPRMQQSNTYRSGVSRRPEASLSHSQSRPRDNGRQVSAVDPSVQRKLERQDARRRERALAEAKWQKEVVRVRGGPDLFMLAIILILLALGTVMVFSSSFPLAIREGRDSNYYIRKQIQNLLLGGGLMTILIFFPIKWYKGWAPIVAYGFSAALLAYTAVFGLAEGEAVRWVRLGPISLQPSELMKISVILLLAWYAEKYEERMKDLSDGLRSYGWNIFKPCMILGIACGLVMIGKHLSGTIIVGAIGFFLLIVAGCKLSWLLYTLIPVGTVAIGGFLALNPYALKRITSFTDENADILSDVWQTTQSVYAIGSGGLAGIGLGQSRQKFGYLGNSHTDFIFSIWCEETGFIGAVLLIALYLVFIWRGYTIAIKAPDRFTMLTAFGITTHVGLQAFLNMCVAADIIMNTGITLPFFSYGGSSLIVLMMEMGVLLCISRQSYRKKADLEREELRIRAGLD